MRTFALLLLFAAPASVASAQLNEPVEFGVRFQPQNFQPFAYQGFSYPGQTFRGAFGQSIPFSQITFPSFSSRAVRREFLSRGGADPIAVRRRERIRLDPPPQSRETMLARRFGTERVVARPSTGDAILRRRVAVVERQRDDRARLLGSRFAANSSGSRTAGEAFGVASNVPGLVRFPSRASRLAEIERNARTRTAASGEPSTSRIR